VFIFTPLKNIILYILIITIAIQSCGLSILELQHCKNYVTRMMRPSERVTLVFTNQQKEQLRFIEEDEFVYDGKYYDIIKSEENAGATSYLCKVDKEDDELENNITKHKNKKETNNEHNSLQLFCHQHISFTCSNGNVYTECKFMLQDAKIINRNDAIIAPPPQLV
jgi:hypothetical protein